MELRIEENELLLEKMRKSDLHLAHTSHLLLHNGALRLPMGAFGVFGLIVYSHMQLLRQGHGSSRLCVEA